MEQVFSPEEILSSTRTKYGKALEECRPLFAVFELTKACDRECKYPMLDCKSCGLTSEHDGPELTSNEINAIVDNIVRAGTVSLSLTGGEPTLRPDLLQIVTYASLRLEVTLITNGQTLDEDYVLRLKKAGVSWTKVYLDSADPEIHDALRGEGTHERACQAIRTCKEEGLKTSIITTLTPLNHRDLRDMIRLAVKLKAPIEATEFLSPEDTGLAMTKEQRRDTQRVMLEAQRIFGRDRIRFANYYVIGEDLEGLSNWADPSKKDASVGYPWGIYGFGIKPNGRIVPDPLLPMELGDLLSQKLVEIWRSTALLSNLRHRGRLEGKCGRCEYRFVCGGHRGRAYLSTGDFMDEDPACWYEPRLT
jgi:radical SAM protein with 4Fe4S-binding SPASM domain